MKTVAISIAFGDIFNEAGCGSLRQPIDGAVARFKAVTKGLFPNERTLVVCTAGYRKAQPTKAVQEREISLAKQLLRYVWKFEHDWHMRLFTESLCWGTRQEIRMGIKLAQQIG